MIIRINVNDNDFAANIEDVLETKINGLIFITDEYFNKQLDELKDKDNPEDVRRYVDISIQRDNVRHWIYEEEIPEDKIDEAKDIIKKSILFLIRNNFKKDLKYLEESIEIEFPKSMDCEWENGEVIYYVPNSYTENKFLLF
ncbi:MAG: hypothetical protein ACI4VQ_00195 [Clostridia bacterium]